jgi:rSAM/selenodomain-associated transferase 1
MPPTTPTTPEPVAIAVLAKAPIPGFAKTRLIPALGPDGAATLQARLTERALETATQAGVGPVTLWCTPDESHPAFRDLATRLPATRMRQPGGDLGARMLAALDAAGGPALVIGTDCPMLAPDHLRHAAQVLREGCDVVIIPVEDGGYGLIGARRPHAVLFTGMEWSTAVVMAETRNRLQAHGLKWQELATSWDVDRPEDLERLGRSEAADLLQSLI